MDRSFHMENRRELYASQPDGTMFLFFAGQAPHQSADAYYPFFANRNFVYLTGLNGLESHDFVLMAKKWNDEVEETLFILPPDAHEERWTGRRLTPEEVRERSGVEDIRPLEEFKQAVHAALSTGKYTAVALDLWRKRPKDALTPAQRFAREVQRGYPGVDIRNCHRQLCAQRTIKKPCEIQAMRKAEEITRAGIEAMMRASRPGMKEYEYKAAFDYALTTRGVLTPASPPIISAGANNFCIHYDSYTGTAQDGDMVLNDVGAQWDGMCADVSRGWPCNGKFSDRQRALYQCAYNTSEYMFKTIRPGIPMGEIDEMCHRYCCEELKKLGLLSSYEEIGKYMWHGGAHHVGYDVHDQVDMSRPVAPGMVFCVDVGIYVEEWGIGFRLEDNCLVTEDGCENLSAAVPRTIDEIEALMAQG